MSTSKLNNLISSLKLIEQNPEDPNYFEKFESIVCQIGYLNDPNSISLLMQFLKDDSEECNLMFEIIHTIEVFDCEVYIREILQASPYLALHYSSWGSLVFIKILNSDKDSIELIRQLKKSSSIVKVAMKDIMKQINQENPEFLAKTTPVLTIASEKDL